MPGRTLDRQILRLAVPALGALAAEALFLLVAGPLVYMPVALLSLAFGSGIVGVWCGLVGLMLARFGLLGTRWLGGRWAVTGAVRAAA
jgi:Na+-driven multidrug efflux pump